MTTQPDHKPAIHFSRLSLSQQIIYALGTGFGTGLAPKAPGTVSSAAVLLLVPLWVWLGFYSSLGLIVLMSIVGIWICGRTAQMMQVHDDSRIVWDEFAGQSIALLPLLLLDQVSWLGVLLAFVVFRLFDVWKPWPIRLADYHIHGGFGIMLDDILAGLMAAVVIYAGFIVAL
ncbi:phosphatidylglycerophosphatase A [Alkanindiges sp. WGS2144]|uniref:phosphatidylglycerophosphatase A family protein n=1 Tax=Alkanindiges sp. WGS2144 TaxID=3366808 RepID=UPI003751E70D